MESLAVRWRAISIILFKSDLNLLFILLGHRKDSRTELANSKMSETLIDASPSLDSLSMQRPSSPIIFAVLDS
jgi:hypothetical protein